MKLVVIYHSETENTKQAAEWIADGMNEVSGLEHSGRGMYRQSIFY